MERVFLSDTVRPELSNIRDELYEFRRDLHRYPELSGKEVLTSAKIKEKLELYGYDVRIIGGIKRRKRGACDNAQGRY